MRQKTDKRLKLSSATVRAIRRRYACRSKRRITQSALAEQFGVHPSTINVIVLGRSRRSVDGPRSFAGHDSTTRARGQYNGGAKLSVQQVRKIRALYAAQSPRVTQRALGEQFGVSGVCIYFIVREKSWKHG